MTTTCYALNAVTGSPSYTGKLARVALGALVGGKNSARPLGAFSGVAPGTPDDTCSISGTTWTVKPHAGVIDLHTAADAGPYHYAVTANETGSINAAHGTHPRIDILWVRIDDPAESDGSSVPACVVGYTAGTAAASPSQPSTPARSMLLAIINVPASGGGSASLTFAAPRTAPAGGIFPVRNTTERSTLASYISASINRLLMVHRADATAGKRIEFSEDATNWRYLLTAPTADSHLLPYYWANAAARTAQTGMIDGQYGYQADTKVLYRYNGAAWKAWESDWITYTATLGQLSGTFAIGTGGSALQETKYKYVNGRLLIRYKFVLGSSGSSMGTGPYFTAPVTLEVPTPRYHVLAGDGNIYDLSATLNYYTKARLNDGSSSQILISSYAGTFANVTSSAPMASWASGDILQGEVWADPA